MRKLLAVLFMAVFCSLAAFCALAEVEEIEPLTVDSKVSIISYGFASQDKKGKTTLYGYILDSKEKAKAKSETPLFYVIFYNDGDKDAKLKLYIRGGKKYDCYWSKTIVVRPHSTGSFLGSGYKTIGKYSGDWMVGVSGKPTNRFTLYIQ